MKSVMILFLLIEAYYTVRRNKKMAQIARFQSACFNAYFQADQDMGWVEKAMQLEVKGRQLVQREIYVEEQVRALKKYMEMSPSTVAPKRRMQLAAYEQELEALNKKYWEHERELYAFHCGPKMGGPKMGPVQRAYIDARDMTCFWYLTRPLIEDCAGRGGCCGRACKCCEKARATDRELRYGHCTANCGCCIRFRGFEIDDKNDMPFNFKNAPEFVGNDIMRSFIFGRAVDDYISPEKAGDR